MKGKRAAAVILSVLLILGLTLPEMSVHTVSAANDKFYDDKGLRYQIVNDEEVNFLFNNIDFGYKEEVKDIPKTATNPEDGKTYKVTGFYDNGGDGKTERLILPEGIKRVNIENRENDAPHHKLREIELPSTLEEINEICGNEFMPALESIKINGNNPRYSVEDGALYDNDTKMLIAYPAAKAGTELSVPEGTKAIGWGAFSCSKNLQKVSLPDSIEKLGEGAFSSAKALKTVNIPRNEQLNTIYGNMFYQCTSLSELNLPENVKTLYPLVFSGTALKKIDLRHVTELKSFFGIRNECFSGCAQLETIILGHDTPVSASDFSGNKSLKTIELPEGHQTLSLQDGVLFTKNQDFGKTLLCYPALKEGEEYTVPEGTGAIEYQAFQYVPNLKKVILPRSLRAFNKPAFFFDDNRTEPIEIVLMSSDLPQMKANTFYGMPDGTTFTFRSESLKNAFQEKDASTKCVSMIKEEASYHSSVLALLPAESITFLESKKEMSVGEEYLLESVIKPELATDDIVFSSSNTKVATVSGAGLVKGLKTGKTTITAKTASGKEAVCTITVLGSLKDAQIKAISIQDHTGKEVKPELSVSYQGTTLKNEEDYTVSYQNNINAGTATALIKGKGAYHGEKEITFEIRKNLQKAIVTGIPAEMEYTGKPLTPVPVIRYGDDLLVEGRDYRLYYFRNIEGEGPEHAGAITAEGLGDYYGGFYKEFIIRKKEPVPQPSTQPKPVPTPQRKQKINYVSQPGNAVYTGRVIKKSVTVKAGSRKLVNGRDYAIVYSGNKNCGRAKMTIKGKGSYVGTYSRYFYIYPKKASLKKLKECMDKMFHSINQQCANKIQGLTRGFSQLIKRSNSIQKMLRPIYDIQKQMINQFGDLFKTNIKIDWDKLAGRMKVWGKYGWTIPPNIPLAVLKCFPQNKDEMDKIMHPFVQKKNMEELFSKLNEKKVNHKDLEEAIFCYRNQKYKGCAMILCALIDGNAFKIQPTKEGERRGSSKVFFRKVQKNGLDKEILKGGFFYLSLVNLTAYLEELYRQADDFKIKTNVLNRNFLLHGMNRIPVRKRDCIQLFLALYNELDIIDYLKGGVKKENWKISDLLE